MTNTAVSNSDKSKSLTDLDAEYQKDKNMILGEGLVFALMMAIGVILIYRVSKRETEVAANQRNFLLSVTHELKSPIAAVKLALETIQKRDLQPQLLQSVSSDATKEATRLEKMVSNLLFSAKLDGNYDYHKEIVSLLPIAESAAKQLSNIYGDRTIELDIGPSQDIYADREALYSVISNLLENALKYSNPDQPVTFRSEDITQGIMLRCLDHGIGIDTDEQKKIFQKFYRIGNEETRKSKGSGIGLYLVNQIVSAHRGELSVSPNKPKGSIFTAFFPHHTHN